MSPSSSGARVGGTDVDGVAAADGGVGRRPPFFDDLPGKSGTRTVTSVSSTSRGFSGACVDVVVVVGVVVVDVVGVGGVVVGVADEVDSGVDECKVVGDVATASDVALTSSVVEEGATDGVGVGVCGAGGVELLCNPKVFQLDGPTELNHGGRGRGVDDVGVAEMIFCYDIIKKLFLLFN